MPGTGHRALDQPRTGAVARASASAIEKLLDALTAERPASRRLEPAMYPGAEWCVAQVEVRVRRH